MTEPAGAVPLKAALRSMLHHPLLLVQDWNWKAAAFSALLRGSIFFLTNRHAGHGAAARAMCVELLYASISAGLAGAVTQRLRNATPQRQTAMVVFVAVPLLMLSAQAAVHQAMGTAHLRFGLLLSLLFASLATGFNWFAMRRGFFVTGSDRPFSHDLMQVPRLLFSFVIAPLRDGSRFETERK